MMNKEKGNQIISEFMGELSTKNYDNSWNDLMPVIEKIESLGFHVTLQTYQCQIFQRNLPYPENWIIDADFHSTTLENAFGGVASFIEWYTDPNKKPQVFDEKIKDSFFNMWERDFYDEFANDEDLQDEDFGSIAIGFFVAKGLDIEKAYEAYQHCIKKGKF